MQDKNKYSYDSSPIRFIIDLEDVYQNIKKDHRLRWLAKRKDLPTFERDTKVFMLKNIGDELKKKDFFKDFIDNEDREIVYLTLYPFVSKRLYLESSLYRDIDIETTQDKK
jgi:hypothetical protein